MYNNLMSTQKEADNVAKRMSDMGGKIKGSPNKCGMVFTFSKRHLACAGYKYVVRAMNMKAMYGGSLVVIVYGKD